MGKHIYNPYGYLVKMGMDSHGVLLLRETTDTLQLKNHIMNEAFN